MPELSQLQRVKPITTEVDMGDGDVVRITFNRNAITSEWEEGNRQSVEQGEDSHVLAKALADVLLNWDVTENGQALEASAANIGKLSISAQGSLFYRIMKASVPTSEEGNASGTTTSTAPPISTSTQESHPNGQPGSTSHTPSESPSLT
jgi:hypothetical protein